MVKPMISFGKHISSAKLGKLFVMKFFKKLNFRANNERNLSSFYVRDIISQVHVYGI